ncbi:MAG: class IV adenylate cyclase [Gemmatimonadetes bacterium]|nr:class IV adenylate cyclase [Gemmatimonadota bacterium]MCC6773988.1 class IV adenylate cyclase [Gemmatimonadaceae bacterium]
MREVELKAVVPDEADARAHLARAGAVSVFSGTLADRRYDTVSRALRARDEVLRLRVQRNGAGVRAVLEFKGPTRILDGFKTREETGSEVVDADALDGILRALGYEVTREVDRHVAVFTVAGAMVRLEQYPRMDLLVEVEGEPACIEAAIAVLGIPRDTFTTDALSAFARRYEARTGDRAALCQRELAGDYRFRLDDA